jgi:hypothetical protein
MQSQANFCEGSYALSIKAPCSVIPVMTSPVSEWF